MQINATKDKILSHKEQKWHSCHQYCLLPIMTTDQLYNSVSATPTELYSRCNIEYVIIFNLIRRHGKL